ncbi:MAG: glycosyltransferase [Candidatus Micrarchaeales archaeon]
MARYNDTTVILPTYNEGKNIGKLVSILLDSYPNISIIVADDGSEDSTQEVVRKISRLYKNVKLLNRSAKGLERGLTNSAVDGILMSSTKYAIVMDADMQHPPKIIAEIKKGLELGNALVVATRKEVPGWEMHRKIISKLLIGVAYVVLVSKGRARCKDIFSGYFGVDRSFFTKTYNKNKHRFVGRGYKILFDLLKCINDSVRVYEVPFTFNVRTAGESKASAKQVIALFESFTS